ncbi:UDP-3-O-(3-hydroxymyristoyl) glucosamine N-acyltransferase [Marinomonas sp. S3726]|jgi:UDP-3-O-[3-hydroxymyristoyl] glucosamine N-acyltransferase|uniref:UDP-3-O-(3-hydroxymyristoyl)glucosamine N-acyltransferase n=1 Tax=Marinomonas sp. S3726 TaxID=579484 RepID=UPI0005FA33A8|nr:UDP-3-O-(3-hydroxymyristoyl)glucosamine N-acyltransferase [Marinomonas sp. S3726]KJZ11038.1 UDP-3-O-(3-hydroxymyristoyl) glucosamine N-acyltransferase [Marinomonas sp. S3726]
MAFSLAQIANHVDGDVIGDSSYMIEKLGTLEHADAQALSFLANPKYQGQLANTQAGAVLIRDKALSQGLKNAVVVSNPYLAFAKLTHLFDNRPKPLANIHPSASIDASASLGKNVKIAANVVIEEGAVLADNVEIGPNSVIGARVEIGENTRIAANVTLYYDVEIGQDCLLHSGCVIGADGFGFAPSSEGWVKIMQLAAVTIGNKVEVGANTTIDRGALENTKVGNGVIIDNQVQIAHNVIIGDNSAIAGCSAIAGSTHIGQRCTISGGVGIIGHLTIVDDVHVTAMSLVSKSIHKAGSYSSGTGLEATDKWRKSAARLRRIDDMAKQIAKLEHKLK